MSVYNEGHESDHTPVVCGLCNTDHSNPDDEWLCVEGQREPYPYFDDEPADIDDQYDVNPYDHTYDYMQDEGVYDSDW